MRIAATGVLLLGGLLGLAACNRDDPELLEEETVAPAPLPTESVAPPASIMRPDLQAEPAFEIPLEQLETTVPFAQGGYDLSDNAIAELREVIETEQVRNGWPIVLRGHTDTIGSDRGNLIASEMRARAVADWLIENGIPEKRITVIPLGEHRPIAPDLTPEGEPNEEGRARNRRVTITVVSPDEQSTRRDGTDQQPRRRAVRRA